MAKNAMNIVARNFVKKLHCLLSEWVLNILCGQQPMLSQLKIPCIVYTSWNSINGMLKKLAVVVCKIHIDSYNDQIRVEIWDQETMLWSVY